MKVDLNDLARIIVNLPDADTYDLPEYHKIVLEPMEFNIHNPMPKTSRAKNLIFKKHFNRGKYEWCLEY